MRKEFQVHLLNEQGIDKARQLAEAFSTLLDKIDELCPGNSREKSIAITDLEKASFNAKRAIAVLPENQKSA